MRRTPQDVLSNFHWIIEQEAARSSQGLGLFLGGILKRHGIRALVNLRGVHPKYRWWRNEDRLCEREGIAHFDAMLDSRLLPTRAMLVALIEAFERAPRPLLVKCAGGQDRTSLAGAIFVLHRGGWSQRDNARAQFGRSYLHFPKRGQKWLAAFPAYAEERARGRPIGAWIREGYDPEDFAKWLTENNLAAGFSGIFSRWKPHQSKRRILSRLRRKQ